MTHYFHYIPPEKSEKILTEVYVNHSKKFSKESLFSRGYCYLAKKVMRKLLIEIGGVVKRLLAPYLHVEITPVDNGYKGLRDTMEFLYPEYLEPGKPKEPRYLNIGAGDFRHRMWHNLDYQTITKKMQRGCEYLDINHDLNSIKSIPIKSDGIK